MTCPTGKSTCPGQLEGTFIEPCCSGFFIPADFQAKERPLAAYPVFEAQAYIKMCWAQYDTLQDSRLMTSIQEMLKLALSLFLSCIQQSDSYFHPHSFNFSANKKQLREKLRDKCPCIDMSQPYWYYPRVSCLAQYMVTNCK